MGMAGRAAPPASSIAPEDEPREGPARALPDTNHRAPPELLLCRVIYSSEIVKCVLQTNSAAEADAAVAALKAAGIATFLDGQHTASLPGFFVPGVLRVCVLDPTQAERAERLVEMSLLEVHAHLSTRSTSAKARRSWVVTIGAILLGVAVLAGVASIALKLSSFGSSAAPTRSGRWLRGGKPDRHMPVTRLGQTAPP